MSFNLTNLQSDTRYSVFGNSSDTTYSDTDLNRNLNRWYETILAWVLTANGDWQVNGDIAITSLVSGQKEYILPTDILKLNEVYINNGSGTYLKAKQRDLSSVEVDNATYTPSTLEFDVMDNSIFIYTLDGTVATVADGLKIIYQKDLTELSGTLTPNLAEPFKRLISLGAALDYCLANEMGSKAKNLKTIIDEGKESLLEYYANRSTARSIRLIPVEENLY